MHTDRIWQLANSDVTSEHLRSSSRVLHCKPLRENLHVPVRQEGSSLFLTTDTPRHVEQERMT
jgi:hypothetical protein